MSAFRAGSFDRNNLPGAFRPFCPSHAVHELDDVNLEGLRNRGKKLILVDVDNTLVKWRTEDFEQHTLDWLAKAKSLGFHVALISNTRNVERLARLSEKLGVKTMRGRFKPSTFMFRQALKEFGVKPGDAIMIGDQLFTDVLGANRAGIESVWLRPISTSDLATTKISRLGERILRGYLYRALTEPEEVETTPVEEKSKPFWERHVVRQFVKFCIVGGSSFAIDYMITMTLIFAVTWDGALASDTLGQWLKAQVPAIFGFAETPREAAMPVARTIAASVAICNSFFWNRLWTFRIRGPEERLSQFRKFVFISVIGLVLNVLIGSLLFSAIPGDSKNVARIAVICSAVIVAFWNFSGQRLYAFRKR